MEPFFLDKIILLRCGYRVDAICLDENCNSLFLLKDSKPA